MRNNEQYEFQGTVKEIKDEQIFLEDVRHIESNTDVGEQDFTYGWYFKESGAQAGNVVQFRATVTIRRIPIAPQNHIDDILGEVEPEERYTLSQNKAVTVIG